MYDKLEEVAARYDELTAILSDPEILKDQNAFAKYSKEQLNTIWDEVKRLRNPQRYYVDISQKLYDLKNEMLNN